MLAPDVGRCFVDNVLNAWNGYASCILTYRPACVYNILGLQLYIAQTNLLSSEEQARSLLGAWWYTLYYSKFAFVKQKKNWPGTVSNSGS